MAIASVFLPLGLGAALAALAGPAQAGVFTCPDRTVRDTPCPVVATPTPEPPRPTCPLQPDALQRAARSEGQFLMRYGDEPAHRRAQHAALSPVAARLRPTNARLAELKKGYDRIVAELEFYKTRPPPPQLLAEVSANVGQFAALTQIYDDVRDEIARVDNRYRCERAVFAKMWAGAAPGASACDRPPCSPG